MANLEVTFVLRLFAEFETVLRDFWTVSLNRRTRPEMRRLMNAIARYRALDDADLNAAHAVRQFRSAITHDGVRVAVLAPPAVVSRPL